MPPYCCHYAVIVVVIVAMPPRYLPLRKIRCLTRAHGAPPYGCYIRAAIVMLPPWRNATIVASKKFIVARRRYFHFDVAWRCALMSIVHLLIQPMRETCR